MNEQRNLILAIALSALILFGFQYLWPAPPPAAPQPTATTAVGVPVPAPANGAAVQAPAAVAATHAETRADAIAQSRRVAIRSPLLGGSIALTGARIDDLTLHGFHETAKPDSPEITLLSPGGAPNPYYAEFGWVPAEAGIKVPGPDSLWRPQAANPELTPQTPVVLTWDNGQGLRFIRTLTMDDRYLFTVFERVENSTDKPVTLYPYALIARTGTPKTEDMYILHEGPLGVLDGTLKEVKYADLRKDGLVEQKSVGGWLGITDKYWLTAIVPDPKTEAKGRMVFQRPDAHDRYQVDFTGGGTAVEPGKSAEANFRFFAGAKTVALLDEYAEKYDINRFSYAIDFGWFWFLTKPFFYMLRMLHDALGNMGLAILALTVVLKLAMFPLANKSYVAMSKMKRLQPEIKKLQDRFGEDKMRLQQEMMALYKTEKVNPVSGCLPILIQIPVFFALYKVLFVTIEMRHAPFYGWIHDLSAPDPTTIFNLFGIIPWDPPSFLMLGVWPLIMGVTMYLQQKLNPAPADPIQAKMFQFLPIIFTFLLSSFAAGLVIYWAWSNTLSILQQWVIMRRAERLP
ncbi:MAG: membrane protein insertase YidC [Magnetospirillum sp.]|nr:membrane protein insertase YidC [Magnetospirillum sp.]